MSIFVNRTATQATRIVRQRYPDAEEEFFQTMLRRLIDDEEDRLGDFIDTKLPGVNVATSTGITFRLKMPGRVTATNADEREGSTLMWKFSPGDALAEPVELFAESMIEGGADR